MTHNIVSAQTILDSVENGFSVYKNNLHIFKGVKLRNGHEEGVCLDTSGTPNELFREKLCLASCEKYLKMVKANEPTVTPPNDETRGLSSSTPATVESVEQ